MKLRLYRRHWLHSDNAVEHPKFPQEAVPFFEKWLAPAGCSQSVVVAYDKGKIVGFFRFNPWAPRGLWALGTWVSKDLRGTGLALRLWERAIERKKPERIHVTAVTRAGRKFVRVLKRLYPEIDWEAD